MRVGPLEMGSVPYERDPTALLTPCVQRAGKPPAPSPFLALHTSSIWLFLSYIP